MSCWSRLKVSALKWVQEEVTVEHGIVSNANSRWIAALLPGPYRPRRTPAALRRPPLRAAPGDGVQRTGSRAGRASAQCAAGRDHFRHGV